VNFNLDQMEGYRDDVIVALEKCVNDQHYILGPNVEAFEREWSAFTCQAHTVGVGNGTDAIRIALLALGVKPGDEVISPAFNVAYTALAVASIGAVNVFVDCDPLTMLMDINKVRAAVSMKTRAIVPVHLYGRMVDVKSLRSIANEYGLMIVEDAAQCHGASYMGDPPGQHSHAVAYSFYPTKNLGALGEAGAITTNIDVVADRARLLRDGGRTDRYLHVLPGINSCLDEMQAAVLRVKLPHLKKATFQRREVANRYELELRGMHSVKTIAPRFTGGDSVHHLYVIRVRKRDELRQWLAESGIPTLIHYPVPVPYQPCFMQSTMGGPWPEAESASREVLSLPMYPTLPQEDQRRVLDGIKDFYESS